MASSTVATAAPTDNPNPTEHSAENSSSLNDNPYESLIIGNGQDVRAGSSTEKFGRILAFAQRCPRALVEGVSGIAVAIGVTPVAEAVGSFSLPVALGDTPKSISYGDEEIALAAGYSAEAHRVGKGGVAIAVSTGCDGVVVSGGEGCKLVIVYHYEVYTAKVGEDGIRPNIPYTVNWKTGEWVEEKAPYADDHPSSQLTGSCTP